ncbi:PE-PPE domain-containing protein [Rhodococcus hoagii]|nr:PE-PPE domain-containing protein [Prescottella equi]
MTLVFFLRGTSEKAPDATSEVHGLLAGVKTKLTAAGMDCVGVDYPAAIGPANAENNVLGKVSMAESIEAGIKQLSVFARYCDATGERFGIVGYSLGSMVASRYLELAAKGEVPVPAFAGLVANPLRALGDSIDGVAKGWGIAGQHGEWPTLPVFEVVNPADAIAACPPRSPLRGLADVLTYAAADDLEVWGRDILRRIREGDWQQTGPYTLIEWADAVGGLIGYLAGGQHTDAYTKRLPLSTESRLDRLARLIIESEKSAAVQVAA